VNGGFLVILLLLALLWLLLIRPQRRRQAVQSQMLSSIEVGDEIVTAGGLYGHVVGVGEDELLVEIAPGTNVRIARRAVAGVVGPDEEEDEEEDEAEDEEELEEAGEAEHEAGEAEHEAADAEHEHTPDETPR
jgi:preprotein translocase subunit YajC